MHAHGPQAIADALAVGADSIEHCTFSTADGVEADPDVLEQLPCSATAIYMTAAVLPGVGASFPAMGQRLADILQNHAELFRAGALVVCSTDGGVGPNKPTTCCPTAYASCSPPSA